MLPQFAIVFWKDVERRLTRYHNMPASEARKWTKRYRQLLKARRVGEAVYNYGEEKAAAAVATAFKQGGFAEPAKAHS